MFFRFCDLKDEIRMCCEVHFASRLRYIAILSVLYGKFAKFLNLKNQKCTILMMELMGSCNNQVNVNERFSRTAIFYVDGAQKRLIELTNHFYKKNMIDGKISKEMSFEEFES